VCQASKDGLGLLQEKVFILHQVEVGPGYYRMGLAFPELAERAKPGQFVMLRVSDRPVPLLRRPFSIHRPVLANGRICGFEVLYKIVGQGTKILSELEPEDAVDVLGPLGNSFSCPEGIRKAWVVAGGVGVASLYCLVQRLTASTPVETTVFIGGCSSNDIICEPEFRSMGAAVCVTTEDCSLGEMGLITSSVEKTLDTSGKPDVIYACGPLAMLKAVGDIAATHDVACQVSLESAMACGFGVCLGCAVEKARHPGTYFHVCSDGPVFDAKDVRM
jgi:dihydroorotate dehydrogenase electron transfer subunit